MHYSRLADIGRAVVEEQVDRDRTQAAKRDALRTVLTHTKVFDGAVKMGRLARGALPAALAKKVMPGRPPGPWPAASHERKVLGLGACVQPTLAPRIEAATARVLDRAGIELVRVPASGCCGSVNQHLSKPDTAKDEMRRNIDAWWPHVEAGAEAIVITASACAHMVTEYGHLLRHDPDYADKAARIAGMTQDISQYLASLEGETRTAALQPGRGFPLRIAFHSPCTLQHALKVRGVVEGMLEEAGYVLGGVPDAHLCCGSAGTYSVLQPELSGQLLENKIAALTSCQPDLIATANIGCYSHLATESPVPVRHWIELLDPDGA